MLLDLGRGSGKDELQFIQKYSEKTQTDYGSQKLLFQTSAERTYFTSLKRISKSYPKIYKYLFEVIFEVKRNKYLLPKFVKSTFLSWGAKVRTFPYATCLCLCRSENKNFY